MSPRTTPARTARAPRRALRPALGVVAVAAAAVAIATAATPAVAAGSDASPQGSRAASRLWNPFFAQLRPVAVVDARHVIVTFDDPSLGEWEGAASKPLTPAQRRAWVAAALKLQQTRLDALSAAGVQFTVDHRFIRVVNGASIVVHGDGAQLIHGLHGVAQVEPVRTVWPAAVDAAGAAGAAAVAGAAPSAPAEAPDTVRIAVLDSGIAADHAAVGGHVGGTAFDATRPDGSKVEELDAPSDAHGTAVAGAALRAAGPDAQVSLRDVRVLDTRPTRIGSEALLGSSDDLIAGLEHAVDPNGDGDFADDGAQVAVIAATTPYAGFADAPEAHAVDGASALGTVVVAAAGNDGASGDEAGTIGSYAAADTALAVGAADLRADTTVVDVALEGGGVDATIDGAALLTAGRPDLPSGARPIVAIDGGSEVTDYLDTELRSRVTGRVVLVSARDGVTVAEQVRAAADAGAAAVLVAADGTSRQGGTLDADGADVPAIGISRTRAAALRDALADGAEVGISFTARDAKNSALGTIAGFSSAGPRLDGIGRPDVVAPGVGMLVAGDAGTWRTVSGTSIAAAWAAGEVAALRAQHPDWDAATVRAAIINTAAPLGVIGDRAPVNAQGAGVLDADAAAKATWVAGTGRIDLGSIAPGGEQRTALGLRALTGAAGAIGAGTPKILLDDGGHTSKVTPSLAGDQLVVQVPVGTPAGPVGGWLVIEELGIRIPWTATVRDASAARVPLATKLSTPTIKRVFGPGAFASTLTVNVGGQTTSDALGLDAVQRLEVHLYDAADKDLGVVGGLDAALPGVYTFGVTGRGPDGARLKPGAYELRVRYIPAADSAGDWREGPVEPITVLGLKLKRAAK